MLSLELLLILSVMLLSVLAALQVPRRLRQAHQALLVLHVQLVNLHHWDLLAQIVQLEPTQQLVPQAVFHVQQVRIQLQVQRHAYHVLPVDMVQVELINAQVHVRLVHIL